MQVINSTEFEQKEVLVGRRGKVGKARVTNDPVLMSMLSTGLYANPLKSMVQEVVFNAWDAHRMGNCQDKPIDVYFNDTTGFIVRDYGPGIPPGETFEDIYFVYGGSTKRDDENQTGGFGLGSKSPFAYSDTFTVTSFYEKQKFMYIMHRVHADNDGGPGHTPVIEGAPTDETGLLVTVPFKNEQDKQKAYRYLHNILWYSGIKINIHYESDDEIDHQLVEAKSMAPNEFILDEDYHHYNSIFAVYGGVKYEIPMKDEYQEEFSFIKTLSAHLGSVFIGFAPNKISPLPTREGLNMNESTIEAIKTQLEIVQEHFMVQLVPNLKISLMEILENIKSTEMQPQYVLYRWDKLGDRENINKLIDPTDLFIEAVNERCPSGLDPVVWRSLTRMCFNHTDTICKMVGHDKFTSIKSLIWAKVYPELKEWRYFLDYERKSQASGIYSGIKSAWKSDLISMWKTLEEVTDQKFNPRIYNNYGQRESWNTVTNIRKAGKYDNSRIDYRQEAIIKALDKDNKRKIPQKLYPDRLWFTKDGEEFSEVMLNGHVILAKTVAALNETSFSFQKHVVPKQPEVARSWSPWAYKNWTPNHDFSPIPAFVVHKKKGGYDAAKAWLESQGITVIEADEPEVKVRDKVVNPDGSVVPAAPTGPAPMYVVKPNAQNWESTEEVKNPSTYVYATKTDLNGYDCPLNASLVRLMLKYAPKMVMIHNKKTANKLESKGVLSMADRMSLVADKLIADEDRMEKLCLYNLVNKDSGFPPSLMEIGEMRKLMNLPYLRNHQKDAFERDLLFLQTCFEDNRYRYRYDPVPRTVRDKITAAVKATEQKDSVALVRKMIKVSNVFDQQEMQYLIEDMKPGEKKMFSQKVIRFLRTV